MNKLDIFCFTSVARTGNFSLTARELMISQQAVSKHIKTLEEELGYQLFFRDSSSIVMTSAGQYILDYLTERDHLMRDIQREFHSDQKEARLSIAWSQWLGLCPPLQRFLQTFQQKHPNIQLILSDLDAAEATHAVKNNYVDFYITSSYSARFLPAFWNQHRLGSMPLYIVKSASSNYAHSQMDLYPFYTQASGEENEAAIRLRVQNTCSKLGFSPQNITICQDMGTVVFNTLLNHGITIGAYIPDSYDPSTFIYEKTHLKTDVMLCSPYYSSNEAASQLKQEMLDGLDKEDFL